MGKTLTAILGVAEIAAGVLTGNVALIITGAVTTIGALTAPGAPKPEQVETALKSPTPARVTAYGTVRAYMAFTLYTTASDGTAIDVGVFHDGRIAAIVGYYLGDVKVTIDGNGRVQAGNGGQFGELSDIVKIYTRLGLPTETAFTQVIAKVPDQWTVNHRGDGCVTGAVLSAPVASKNYAKIYPTGGPNNMPLSLVLQASCVFDWRDPSQSQTDPSTWKWSENAIVHLADYLLRFDNKRWAYHVAPTLAFWTAAANDADVAMPLAGVEAVISAAAPRGSGHLTLSNVNGLTVGTSIAIGATGNTSLAETRTVTSIAGLVIGLSSPLANDHPQGSQVTWLGNGASEPRYRTCLAFKHTDDHKAVIANLLACCDGFLAPRADGALVVYSGRYYVPTVSIGPDEIVSYTLQDGVDEENAINSIALTYVSANHDYNTVDTTAWTDDDDIARRGKVLAETLANQVPSFSQARRLGKRAMARINAPKRGTITTNSAGRIVRGQRFVNVSLIDAGVNFYTGPVEITKLTRNLSTGGVTFDWILADPAIDQWTPAVEEGAPAPVGNVVAAQPLAAPVITASAVNFGAQAADGVSGAYLQLTVAGLNRADVTWFARTRQVGAAVWGTREYDDIPAGDSVMLATEFVPTDTMVEAEVSYQTGDGIVSPWSASVQVDTHADTQVPDPASAPTLVAWGATLSLQTAAIPRARAYRWRLYDGTNFVASYDTVDRTFVYTSAQAAKDGAKRGLQGQGLRRERGRRRNGIPDPHGLHQPRPASRDDASHRRGGNDGNGDQRRQQRCRPSWLRRLLFQHRRLQPGDEWWSCDERHAVGVDLWVGCRLLLWPHRGVR